MAGDRRTTDEILRENAELRQRLEEADETIRAIRSGQVDAFLVENAGREEVFTLETADRPYRLFVETMQQGAVTLSENGAILFCNGYFADLLGVGAERLPGTGLRGLVSEDDRPVYDSLLVAGRGEVRLQRSDGSRVPVELTLPPVPSDDGDGTRFVLITDLTEQKHYEDLRRAQEALRESEDRFRMVADNMDQLAWTCDKLGNCNWYNQRWIEYTGLSFEDMKGWNWSKVQHPDHLARVVERVKRSAQTGEPWEDTFPLRGSDGRYRWFLSRALPMKDEQGNILRWFGTNTDVTEQLAAEEALRQADRRKDEFLATLAHELRNPLAVLRNMLEIIKRADLGPDLMQRTRRTMDRQLNQMVRLIEDLLDLSRINHGRITLRKQRMELTAAVEQALEAARPSCSHKRQELIVKLPAEPIRLEADFARLVQVVDNLLNNACKFTPPGGRIHVAVERDGNRGVIRVSDTGIGITADQLPRVFDMFLQFDDRPTGRGEGGLGIGLTLVKDLVEMHGGTVEAASVGPGQGTEFVVRLPVLSEPEAQESGRADADEIRQAGASRRPRALVVDDNVDSAESLQILLELSGHVVDRAHDGQEAIGKAARLKPDVILLDIGLPGMDGYETARRIRSQADGKPVLLIALTGWGRDEDRRRSEEAGFDAHLVKPLNFDELEKLLIEADLPGS